MAHDAVLIAGPTASGKSGAAIALAERIGGVVVNADSMQVYRETRILTARPSAADEDRAPHLLYGHASAREPYSVGHYQSDVTAVLKQLDGRTPIFVGGTGLYFSVLTDGIAEIPVIPAATRAKAMALREHLGAEEFFAELAKRDPQSAARLNATDTQRTLRAYEVFEETGKPLSYWQTRKGKPVLDGLHLARFVLAPDRAELHRRIDARFEEMVVNGAMDEAVALEGLAPTLPAAKILGLRELQDVHHRKRTLAEATTLAQTATRQYAKRQMTWFRKRMKDWAWVSDANDISIAPAGGAP
ncbi:MAG TPA: tRNA (adenosine(37)-N6)-dimethylallyltransferase MiaA [Rhizomicrobium sp.]|nr:tRNA (adenosine(37)-N6)-dimethylallyltransferase MiaA [Rhizomicrobium sp.]